MSKTNTIYVKYANTGNKNNVPMITASGINEGILSDCTNFGFRYDPGVIAFRFLVHDSINSAQTLIDVYDISSSSSKAMLYVYSDGSLYIMIGTEIKKIGNIDSNNEYGIVIYATGNNTEIFLHNYTNTETTLTSANNHLILEPSYFITIGNQYQHGSNAYSIAFRDMTICKEFYASYDFANIYSSRYGYIGSYKTSFIFPLSEGTGNTFYCATIGNEDLFFSIGSVFTGISFYQFPQYSGKRWR